MSKVIYPEDIPPPEVVIVSNVVSFRDGGTVELTYTSGKGRHIKTYSDGTVTETLCRFSVLLTPIDEYGDSTET